VPIQSRCPSCAAALPAGAAWCSLCHADLRAKPAPVAAAASTPDAADASLDLAVSEPSEPSVPRASGRHAKEPVGRREAPRPAAAREPVGRREARRATQTLDPSLVLEGIDLPSGEATPDQVEEIADRMLARLAVAEPQARVLDPADLPGGKWGFAAAAGAGVLAVMLLLLTVLGALFGG